MKKSLVVIICFILTSTHMRSQGCIPVRSINAFGQFNFTDNGFTNSSWQINATGRYFRSFRDFKEKVDLKTPAQNESVNKVYTLDLSVSKMLANGWSLNVSIPI